MLATDHDVREPQDAVHDSFFRTAITAIWGDFDAHEIFDNLNGELAITPVKVGFAAYYESIDRTGTGNDSVVAGRGADTVLAGDGNDTVQGNNGDDVLVGGDGNEILGGNRDQDISIGGDGSDTLQSGGQENLLIGGTTDFDADADALGALRLEWIATRSLEALVSDAAKFRSLLRERGGLPAQPRVGSTHEPVCIDFGPGGIVQEFPEGFQHSFPLRGGSVLRTHAGRVADHDPESATFFFFSSDSGWNPLD